MNRRGYYYYLFQIWLNERLRPSDIDELTNNNKNKLVYLFEFIKLLTENTIKRFIAGFYYFFEVNEKRNNLIRYIIIFN